MAKTDFLTLNDLSQSALFKVLERAHALKKDYQAREFTQSLSQHVLAMIFEKSSTRTRVSFEAGMTQLGGSAIFYLHTIHNSVAENLSKIPRACCLKW